MNNLITITVNDNTQEVITFYAPSDAMINILRIKSLMENKTEKLTEVLIKLSCNTGIIEEDLN